MTCPPTHPCKAAIEHRRWVCRQREWKALVWIYRHDIHIPHQLSHKLTAVELHPAVQRQAHVYGMVDSSSSKRQAGTCSVKQQHGEPIKSQMQSCQLALNYRIKELNTI